MRFWTVIAFILILSIIEIFADLSLMEWATKHRLQNKHWGLLIGIGIYSMVGLVYGISLIYGKLSIANTVWQIFSIVIVFAIGVYMYREVPTIGQWIGIAIIVGGLLCIITSEKEVWSPGRRHPFWHKPWSPFSPDMNK